MKIQLRGKRQNAFMLKEVHLILTNAPIAMRMGQINALAEKTGSQIIPADATNMEDLQNLVTKAMEILGGKLDFVLLYRYVCKRTKRDSLYRI